MMMLMFKNEEMRHLLSNQNISVCMATLLLTVGVAFLPSHPDHQVMTKFSIMKGRIVFEKLAFLRKFDQAHPLESLSSLELVLDQKLTSNSEGAHLLSAFF